MKRRSALSRARIHSEKLIGRVLYETRADRPGTNGITKMRRLCWLLLLTFYPGFAQTSLVFNWHPNPSNFANWPPCSKARKKMCQTGYSLSDITVASAPVLIDAAIAQESTTYTVTPLPSAGPHTFSLVVNARNSSGKPVQSEPASVKVSVPYMFSITPAGFRAEATPASVVFSWAGNSNGKLQMCSEKVKTACLSSYTLLDVTSPSNPVSISASIANVSTYTWPKAPQPGERIYSLVANGIDQSGSSRSSPPARATILVRSTR
jgi:hypothetical protein